MKQKITHFLCCTVSFKWSEEQLLIGRILLSAGTNSCLKHPELLGAYVLFQNIVTELAERCRDLSAGFWIKALISGWSRTVKAWLVMDELSHIQSGLSAQIMDHLGSSERILTPIDCRFNHSSDFRLIILPLLSKHFNKRHVCVSAGEVSLHRFSSWRLEVRGHEPESPWAPRVKKKTYTHSHEFMALKLGLTVGSSVYSCVLFIHWTVEVSKEGGVTPKIELLTKIPERGDTCRRAIWF